ncbi:MAG: hypothetical protein R6U55_01670 [Desulfovermiculus sp.]
MELAIQLIADLIDHLKKEYQKKETRCFYCGGLHKTVDCCSQKREEFIQKLLEIQAIAQSTRDEYLFDENNLNSNEPLFSSETQFSKPKKVRPDICLS